MYAGDPRINFFSDPKWSVELSVPAIKSLSDLTIIFPFEGKVTYDRRELRCMAGFQVKADTFNFTTAGFYGPTFHNNFSLATGTIFNIESNPAYYNEVNILIGFFLRFSPCKWFTLKHSITSLEKFDFIKTGGDDLVIGHNDFAFDLKVLFFPVKGLTIALGFGNYDDYKYYLFFTPIGKIKVEYDWGSVAIGFDFKAHFIDFFTLSATENERDYRLYCKINF